MKVTIEEHICQTFDIEASNEAEALRIATERWKNGDLILEDAEAQSVLVSVEDSEFVEIL